MNIMVSKAIRLVCRQSMVNYAKPNSHLLKETYPLPPYSTVIGMIHAICGVEPGTYIPMEVSVQGDGSSTSSEIYSRYSFTPNFHKKDRDKETGEQKVRGYAVVENKETGKITAIQKGLGYVEVIDEIELVIHIVPKEEKDFETIMNGLGNPVVFPALGRHEDLLDIESFEIVDLEEVEEAFLKRNAYIPMETLKNILPQASMENVAPGTVYKIRKRFGINEKTNRREWLETVRVKHVRKNSSDSYEEVLVDSYGDLVFLA